MARTKAARDPLQAYLEEVRRIDVLEPREEKALALRYREGGDRSAAQRLITANLRLVVAIARDYRRAHRNILDLIQEGNVGLMVAVAKFDPARGVKLSSYATWWIRAYILRFILNNWRLVRLGTTRAQRTLFYNLRKEQQRCESLGITPTPALIAARLQVPERAVVEMDRRMSETEVSLDAPAFDGDGSGSSTNLDRTPCHQAGADELLATHELREELGRTLERFGSTLDGRERCILGRRLMADSPMTLQQIGDEHGLSRERVRQIERRLVERLRGHLLRTMPEHFDAHAAV